MLIIMQVKLIYINWSGLVLLELFFSIYLFILLKYTNNVFFSFLVYRLSVEINSETEKFSI